MVYGSAVVLFQSCRVHQKLRAVPFQEPGPAKVPVTGMGIPEAEKVPDSRSIIWQEELHSREPEAGPVWALADVAPLGSPAAHAGMEEAAPLSCAFKSDRLASFSC